mmetsp:Transcript_165989/g.532850  ORF Transcript_165989/g.532850 Transcript_165989/m.532850 type:complete len:80 (+) Transcript_165989:448-687(+)
MAPQASQRRLETSDAITRSAGMEAEERVWRTVRNVNSGDTATLMLREVDMHPNITRTLLAGRVSKTKASAQAMRAASLK